MNEAIDCACYEVSASMELATQAFLWGAGCGMVLLGLAVFALMFSMIR